MTLRLLFDTEANGFLEEATQVHCIAAANVDTGERYDWRPGQIEEALDFLSGADVLIAHNGLRYDVPLLHKLFSWSPSGIVRDTMILARLKYPNVFDLDEDLIVHGKLPKNCRGKHTLRAWGHRLGEHKTEYEGGFDEWSQDMHDYMIQDVTTNVKLWNYLKADEYSQPAIELEHRIARVCDQMEKFGAAFDVKVAQRLHAELLGKQEAVGGQLTDQFGSWWAPIDAKQPFTPKRDNSRMGYVAGAPCTKLKLVEFNPGSRDHIIKVLKDRGWEPTEFTKAGKPEINEAVVSKLPTQFPEMAGLSDYLMLDKRLSQLAEGDQAWLKVVKDDGRIHGVINPMGTVTSRAAHMFPNLGQVPASKKPYGKQCRQLFRVPDGWKLVGADMGGLELRALAHYLAPLDGGLYAKTVLEGDPHWANAIGMGLVGADVQFDKDNALHEVLREEGSKRYIYADIYGCGNLKAGQIIYACLVLARKKGGPEGEVVYKEFFGDKPPTENFLRKIGGRVRNSFASKIAGFSQLKTKLSKQLARHDWVPGLDGRRIPTRSEHSALNYLIQSAGAILCKNWGANAVAELEQKFKLGWDGEVVPMLWVHDEYQVACREGLEQEVGAILVKHARSAGEPYEFRVQLDSKFKVGQSWASTH